MFNNLFINGISIRSKADQNSYVFDLPVVRNLIKMERLEIDHQVTFFVGENGTGKSTLLEAIAVAYGFNAEGGTRNFNFSTEQTHSDLYRHLIVSKGVQRPDDGFFLRAESFYNLASEIDKLDQIDPLLNYYGGRSLHAQSHGESFLSLVLNRFSGNGVYILDEPEAALSPSRQMTLLAAIDSLVKNKSQFLIATHSPILMSYPGAAILMLEEDDICLTPYQETEHFLLTKQFLNNPQKMLKYLLDD